MWSRLVLEKVVLLEQICKPILRLSTASNGRHYIGSYLKDSQRKCK